MGEYRQQNRQLRLSSPLGDDALLLQSFSGVTALSQLFRFKLEMLAENGTKVPFDAVLGQRLTMHVALPDQKEHHLNGLCVRLAQAGRDATFTSYEAEIVPDVWKLTRRVQSRIFQRQTVPEILKTVFSGFDVDWQVRERYEPRHYCVQYRESDFDFAARLMEEEAIHFFFRHGDGTHTLVVSDSHHEYPTLPGEHAFTFEELAGGARDDNRLWGWVKEQEVRSVRTVLWDHTFEVPHRHLEAESSILGSIAVGAESHELKLPGTEAMELYDWPGGYAKRYDGIGRDGGEQPEEVEKVFKDNQRTTEIRMDEEAVSAVVIRARTNVKHLLPGYTFTLKRHVNADGDYLVQSVKQKASFGADYRSGKEALLTFECELTCLPAAVCYRPPRVTPKPVVRGSQTAVVVGPPGEEIFCDRYGRVKVQFHWDREGKSDARSSCWIRVATSWAGQQWGSIQIPRVGQEVLVDFLEGDPDRPIIVGSVYNPGTMPPYDLPDGKTQSGIKSRSSPGGGPKNFNEIRFEDKKGKELVYAHAERNLTTVVEADEGRSVGGNRGTGIGNNDSRDVGNNDTHKVGADQRWTIGASRSAVVSVDDSLAVGGSRQAVIAGSDLTTVGAIEKHMDGVLHLVKAPVIVLDATVALTLRAGGTTVTLTGAGVSVKSAGSVKVKAPGEVSIDADGAFNVIGSGGVDIFSGGDAKLTAAGTAKITGMPVKLN